MYDRCRSSRIREDQTGMKPMPERNTTSSGGVVPRPAALTSEVYDAILDRITSLEIAPGARINVDTLARELGVSQTPIREALSRLEAEGLVLKTHLIGHRAGPQLTRAQIEQLFELRLLIEPAGAAMAARALGPRSHEMLSRLHAEMSGLPSKAGPTYSEFARKDAEFHAVIAEASGNAFLSEALAKLHTHVHIFRLVFHTRVTTEAIGEHTELLAALLRGDAAGSKKSMREHILASRSRVLTLLPR
jgi:DNA-binding GntR family transcriptional regulator